MQISIAEGVTCIRKYESNYLCNLLTYTHTYSHTTRIYANKFSAKVLLNNFDQKLAFFLSELTINQNKILKSKSENADNFSKEVHVYLLLFLIIKINCILSGFLDGLIQDPPILNDFQIWKGQ